MATLDPELNSLLTRSNYYRQHPDAAAANPAAVPDPQQLLHIAVSFTGSIDPLLAAGFQAGSLLAATAYGSIRLAQLQALAALPSVDRISKQRRKSLQLTTSVPDIRANAVWNFSSESFTGTTGKNAIIGIVDTGINFRHESFQTPSGLSRILRIWDQTLTPQGSEASPAAITDPAIGSIALGYGVEYTQTQISQTLQNVSNIVRHQDEHGHGSHVAGIAAGNGRQEGSCKGSYSYIGVAPEADIIMVRLWGLTAGDSNQPSTSSGTMIDAIAYILNHAKHSFNKPVSINLSLGIFSDTMDGTAPDCVTMNNLLNHTGNDEGFAIVFAAGNEADSNFHAKTSLDPGATIYRLRFRVAAEDSKSRYLSIRYSGGSPDIRITSPVSGTGGVLGWVSPGNAAASSTANGSNPAHPTLVPQLNIDHTTPGRIAIHLEPKIALNTDGEIDISKSRYNMPGDWEIEIKNTGSGAAAIDAYCIYGSGHDRKSIRFLEGTTVQSTLSEESTATEVITVGAYNAANGRLAGFSGRGLTLDLRQKPEITAPGVGVMSAGISRDLENEGCCCDCCHDYYVAKDGTSMAAPHVAGAVALLLDKNPNLTHSQLLAALTAHARPAPAGASLDDSLGWGVGKLDIKAAIEPVSAGGGSPGGPHAPFFQPRQPAPDGEARLLLDRFKRSLRGNEYLGLFHTYFREVRTLINRNKRVATVWHRCKGPLWLRTAIQAAGNPSMVLPDAIEQISLGTAIENMRQMLQRYGSRQLAADLDFYAPALHQIEGGQSLWQLMERIAEPETAPIL